MAQPEYKSSHYAGYRKDLAVPGMAVGIIDDRFKSVKHVAAWNTTGESAETALVTIPASPDNSTQYQLKINGIDIGATTDSSATGAELRTAIYANYNANSALKQMVSAELSSTNAIIFKSKLTNRSLVIETNSGTTTSDIVVTKTASTIYENWLITAPTTVDNSTKYQLTVAGVTVSFTTDANATPTELIDGLYDAWRSHPQVAGGTDLTKIGTTGLLVSSLNPYVATRVELAGSPVNPLVLSKLSSTQNPGQVKVLKFGTFAAFNTEKVGAYMTKRPSTPNDKIAGYVDKTRWTEVKNYSSVAPGAISYEEGIGWLEGYALITDTDAEAYYASCIESDISPFDKLYVSIASGTEGWVTKSSTDAIDPSPSIITVEPSSNNDNLGVVTYSEAYSCYLVGVRFSYRGG